MKISVDFDCTPEEARRLVGLPDLTSVHRAYLDRMESAVRDGLTPEYFGDMMKKWGPMSEASLGVWKQIFDQMSGKK